MADAANGEEDCKCEDWECEHLDSSANALPRCRRKVDEERKIFSKHTQ